MKNLTSYITSILSKSVLTNQLNIDILQRHLPYKTKEFLLNYELKITAYK